MKNRGVELRPIGDFSDVCHTSSYILSAPASTTHMWYWSRNNVA